MFLNMYVHIFERDESMLFKIYLTLFYICNSIFIREGKFTRPSVRDVSVNNYRLSFFEIQKKKKKHDAK